LTKCNGRQGATIDEIARVMGWQRHTVRGLISGALKKRLGLQVISEKTERGRLYRILTGQPV
jgi:predicted transcriptional regulator